MPTKLAKCEKCSREFYPNQMLIVGAGATKYKLCPDCHGSLCHRIGDKGFVGSMIKSTLTMGEVLRIRRERGREYAVAGYAQRLALPGVGA
jgi:hypothetical protein